MKFIALDIEWNIDNQREILQLATRLLDERYHTIASYFKRFRPKNMKDLSLETQKLLHLNKEYLENEQTFEEGWEHFIEWLESFHDEWLLVVWNNEAIEVLEAHLKRLGYRKPYKKVLILQELIYDLTIPLEEESRKVQGFVKICKQYGVEVDKKLLHQAYEDVKWLSVLFKRFMIAVEIYHHQHVNSGTRYYRSQCGEKVHILECKSIKRKHYAKVYEDLCSGIRKGYMPCKKCIEYSVQKVIDEMKEYVDNLPKYNEIDESAIEELCKKYNFQYQLVNDKLFITTETTKWYLLLKGREVQNIYHENYRATKHGRSGRKFQSEYHKQAVEILDLRKALNYIYKHDAVYKKNRTMHRNINRVDELLKQINKEI